MTKTLVGQGQIYLRTGDEASVDAFVYGRYSPLQFVLHRIDGFQLFVTDVVLLNNAVSACRPFGGAVSIVLREEVEKIGFGQAEVVWSSVGLPVAGGPYREGVCGGSSLHPRPRVFF
jgi:hypothetical protein